MEKQIASKAVKAIKRVCAEQEYFERYGIPFTEPDISGKGISELIELFTFLKYDLFDGYQNDSDPDRNLHMFNERMCLLIKICEMAVSDLVNIRDSIPTDFTYVESLKSENIELKNKLSGLEKTLKGLKF